MDDPELLLWTSPGWPPVRLTQAGLSGQIFDTIVYFDDALRNARILLYALDPTGAATNHPSQDAPGIARPGFGQSSSTIAQPTAIFGSNAYQAFLQPARSPRTADPNDILLPVLALHSGGTVQTNSNDLRGGIAHFVADAGAVYSLSFAQPEKAAKGPYHSLQIEAADAKSKVRTRGGYYAR